MVYSATIFPKNVAGGRVLKTDGGDEISALAFSSGVADYTETIDLVDNIGYATLLVQENKSGGAGDVDLSVEYSLDGTNFYTASDTDMAGTLTAEGNIVTALQNDTVWIVFPVRMAVCMRIKIDPDADSQLTMRLIYLRDR